MKTILEFDDDDLEGAQMAFNGAPAHYALGEINEFCRRRMKYEEISDEEHKVLDSIRSMTILDLS